MLGDRDAGAQDLAELMDRLRAEVREQDFDIAADPAGKPVPGGVKADPAGVTSLLIASSLDGRRRLTDAWLNRHEQLPDTDLPG